MGDGGIIAGCTKCNQPVYQPTQKVCDKNESFLHNKFKNFTAIN